MCSCFFSDKLESGGIGTGYGKNASHSALKTEQQIKKEEKGSKKERLIDEEIDRRTMIRPAGPPIARTAGIMI